MGIVLAVIGSRGIGEPVRYTNEIYPTATFYPTYKNMGQLNLVFKELNSTIKRIVEIESAKNPDFNPRIDISLSIGDADGADELARIWAVKNQLNYTVHVAKWKVFGKSAGHRRNPDIIAPADYVVAFYDGESSGTAGGIEYAKKREKKLKVIRYLKHVPYLGSRTKKRKVTT